MNKELEAGHSECSKYVTIFWRFDDELNRKNDAI